MKYYLFVEFVYEEIIEPWLVKEYPRKRIKKMK